MYINSGETEMENRLIFSKDFCDKYDKEQINDILSFTYIQQ